MKDRKQNLHIGRGLHSRNANTAPKEGRVVFLALFSKRVPPRVQVQYGSLLKRGHDATIFKRKDGANSNLQNNVKYVEIQTPFSQLVAKKGFKSIAVLLGYLEYTVRLGIILRQSIKRGDIVQLCHPFLLALVPILSELGTFLYYDSFEFYRISYGEIGVSGRMLGFMCEVLENHFVPKLNGVTCVSSHNGWLKKRFEDLNRRTLELWNLPQLDQQIDSSLMNELQRHFFGKELIIYIGGLKEEKGLKIFPNLVRLVVSALPNAHFVIVGKLDIAGGAEKWRISNRLENFCTYIPWLPLDQMNAYLRIAGVGLILSLPMGIHLRLGPGNGRKLFSYMSAGVPVIAPNFGQAWDLVENEEVGIRVDTTNAEDVAQGIVTLLTDYELREKMSSNARRAFEKCYNWHIEEEKYLNMVENND